MKHDKAKIRGREDLASYCKELVTRLKSGECQASLLLEVGETAKLNNKLLIGIAKETLKWTSK